MGHVILSLVADQSSTSTHTKSNDKHAALVSVDFHTDPYKRKETETAHRGPGCRAQRCSRTTPTHPHCLAISRSTSLRITVYSATYSSLEKHRSLEAECFETTTARSHVPLEAAGQAVLPSQVVRSGDGPRYYVQARATSEVAAEGAVSTSGTQSLLTGVAVDMVRSRRTQPLLV